MTLVERALSALEALPPEAQLEIAARWLRGAAPAPWALGDLAPGDELSPEANRLDGSVLDAIAARALGGARGAVFTRRPEARLLALLGLARVAARRGVEEAEAVAVLAGLPGPTKEVSQALDGVRVLDPCCGAGALLVAALSLAREAGFRIVLSGADVAPLALAAARARLALLGATATLSHADAFDGAWAGCDLLLSNPPFVRHEALTPALKARAAARSGLSRQADLSAHLAAAALRHAPDVALVWPRALDTARSAEPLRSDAHARGGFAWRIRSRVAGSFAASVDTVLAVWSEGHAGRPDAEASVALASLTAGDVAGLARNVGSRRIRFLAVPRRSAADPRGGAIRVADVCDVRFGMKSGCNDFFHLRALTPGRFESALLGEVALAPDDVQQVLTSLREASAPERASPRWFLFRPARASETARRYVAAGEALGVHERPTCRGRSPWWRVAGTRPPAPVLYPAKVGARAFAFLNADGWCEDKKWHALFPRDAAPSLVALVLGATSIRLAIDRAARQLTGQQAIADVDCRVLAGAPFPRPEALATVARALDDCRRALRHDPVTTEVDAMLARPAQRELDEIVGRLLGRSRREVAAERRALVARIEARLAHAAQVRAAIGGRAG